MKRQTIIFLLCTIGVMLIVIAGMVAYLYHTPAPSKPAMAQAETPDIPEADAEPLKSEDIGSELPDSQPESAPDVQKSFSVTNGATKKTNLLRQNEDQTLELVDHTGKSLWKISFPGKLCGSVVEVDFYKNNKIQYLVADGRRVHLFDRLGREVDTFPRTMPSDISFGPEEIMNHGQKIYRVQTGDGPMYFNLHDTKVLTELPE